MRLVQVNYAFDPVLVEPDALLDAYRTLTESSDALTAAGLQVSVAQAFGRDARVTRGGVDYTFCRPGVSAVDAMASVHEAVVRREPDVVHVNGLDAPFRVWQLRRLVPMHVPIVVQDHASLPPIGRALRTRIRRWLMRAADAYLFTSRAQADGWVRGGFMLDEAVHELLEASTSMRPVARATARAISGIHGVPALLWVGRLDANKDPLTVLDAFEQSLGALPNATLTMVFAEGALEHDIRSRVARSPALRDKVRLAGFVPHDQLASWYTSADLFVLGSAHEGSGYAVLEACACGCSPIVTDIPAFRAITRDGAIGALWRRGDADALQATLLVSALRDRERERRRVVEHFAQHLSWTSVGQRARAIYEAVRETRSAGPGATHPRDKLRTSPCRAEQPTSNASNTTERPSSMR